MWADRTGFEQFHHINYHINSTGGGDNTNRDFLSGTRCTLSVSWHAFRTFDHFFLSSYHCDTILDSVYRHTVHVRMYKTETESAPWRPVSTGKYISVIALKLSSLFWLLLAWIAGVASCSTIKQCFFNLSIHNYQMQWSSIPPSSSLHWPFCTGGLSTKSRRAKASIHPCRHSAAH